MSRDVLFLFENARRPETARCDYTRCNPNRVFARPQLRTPVAGARVERAMRPGSSVWVHRLSRRFGSSRRRIVASHIRCGPDNDRANRAQFLSATMAFTVGSRHRIPAEDCGAQNKLFRANSGWKIGRHRLRFARQTAFTQPKCGVLSAGICTIATFTLLLCGVVRTTAESQNPDGCLAAQYAACNGIPAYASALPTCTMTPRSGGGASVLAHECAVT